MLSTEHTQSLSDFRQKASETLDRLAKTGEAEILTVNGEARAVLLSPAVYDEMARELETTRDVAAIRNAMKQFEEGKGIPIEQAHRQLRDELLAMRAAQDTRK
jgi:PHD/YefM family antitoxin component YafN of YafNO toxin-antitoxin module